ncbi:hypothetical protein O4G98_04025 [Zoogloeaceae bacterium G21618-S1]|nr:hypothetical protein [Zoogloeaceae bacterium G21618-S1]
MGGVLVWIAGGLLFIFFFALGQGLNAPSADVAAASLAVMGLSAVGFVKVYRSSARRCRAHDAEQARIHARQLESLLKRVDDPSFEHRLGSMSFVFQGVGAVAFCGLIGMALVNDVQGTYFLMGVGWVSIAAAVFMGLVVLPVIGRDALVMNTEGFVTPHTVRVPWHLVSDVTLLECTAKGYRVGYSLNISLGEAPRTVFRPWSIYRYSPAKRVIVPLLFGRSAAHRDIDFPLFCAFCARAQPGNQNFLIHLPEAYRKKLLARLDSDPWLRLLNG